MMMSLAYAAAGSTAPEAHWWTSFVLPTAVAAALISSLTAVYLAVRKSRDEEVARTRDMFAEAHKVVAEYKEFPYAIRRRRADAPSEERVRLSEALRDVQARLSYFEAWTLAENKGVGDAYAKLVREVRKVAGDACNEAWEADPITSDSEMNIGRALVDLTSLKTLETQYVVTVEEHLAWCRKLFRKHGRSRRG